MTPLKQTPAQLKRLERNLTDKSPVHLRTKESNELGGTTRYHSICGASGLDHREYSKDITRKAKRGTVQIVTCPACLKRAGWKG